MRIVTFILAYLLFATCKPALQPRNDDEKMILQARSISNQAIADHDTVALAKIWCDDYHVISSRNFEVAGREKNRHHFAMEFSTKKEVVYVRTPRKIEVNTFWNMAAEQGDWNGQWQEPDGLVKLSGTYYAKWHKENGEWKIRAEIFTPLTCSGSVFCKQQPKIN